MSNQFASISNALGILKINYQGPVITQFNDSVPLYKGAEKGKEKWNGLQINKPLKLRRNPGIGATSDGGDLPAIGKQTTGQATIVSKFNYLRFGITGPMMAASQGDKGSFVNLVSFEMEEGLNDVKNDVNRQLYWSGRGDLATLSAAAVASTVITATGRTSTEDGSKFLDVGMVVDIYSTAGVQKAAGVGITAISGTTTATITLDTAVTAASGDIIVRQKAFNNEIQGLETFLDGATSSIYGIDRSLFPVFQGNVIDAASEQLRLDHLQRALNEARRRGGVQKVSALFCDFDSERFYNKLLVADKRYIGEKAVGDGTFVGVEQASAYLAFAGIPVVPDKDAPGSRFYFMNAAGWKKYVLGQELSWVDDSGSYMITQSGSDSYEVRLRLFANMFHEKPASCAKLSGYIAP